MITIMHLSDLRFGTESPQVVASLTRQILQVCPDVFVISGDLTQRARRREFHAAKRFIDAIDISDSTAIVVPGNHDIPLYNPGMRVINSFYKCQRGSRWRDQRGRNPSPAGHQLPDGQKRTSR